MLFVLNGGKSDDDPSVSAIELQKGNAEVFVLGLGSSNSLAQLNQIASDPDSKHVFMMNYTRLATFVKQTKMDICQGNMHALERRHVVCHKKFP